MGDFVQIKEGDEYEENKTGKKHTILFRQLVKAVIPSTGIWAERTADTMEKEFPIVQACRGTF